MKYSVMNKCRRLYIKMKRHREAQIINLRLLIKASLEVILSHLSLNKYLLQLLIKKIWKTMLKISLNKSLTMGLRLRALTIETVSKVLKIALLIIMMEN